jgi:hypothetical protein
METVMLEKTLLRVSSLLALGFGEAGMEIVGENMVSFRLRYTIYLSSWQSIDTLKYLSI